MSAIEIAAGVTALAIIAMTLRTWWVKRGLFSHELVLFIVSAAGSAWFIARLCGVE